MYLGLLRDHQHLICRRAHHHHRAVTTYSSITQSFRSRFIALITRSAVIRIVAVPACQHVIIIIIIIIITSDRIIHIKVALTSAREREGAELLMPSGFRAEVFSELTLFTHSFVRYYTGRGRWTRMCDKDFYFGHMRICAVKHTGGQLCARAHER